MNQMLNELKNLNQTQLIFIGIVGLVVLIIIWLISRVFRLKRLTRKVGALEVMLTSFTSLPIEFRLNRVQGLAASNPEFKEVFERYTSEFEQIKSFYDNDIREPMSELDDALYYKKITKVKKYLKQLSPIVEEYGQRCQVLLTSLEEASEVESIQRVEIIRIKERYRNIKRVYDQSKERLSQVEYSIEDYFRKIEQSFSGFERAMQQSEFEQARKLAEAIEAKIQHIEKVVEQLPDLIVKTRQLIPKRVDGLVTEYQDMKENGFWLVPYDIITRVEQVNAVFKKVLGDINRLEIDYALNDVEEIQSQLTEMMNQLAVEKETKPVFESMQGPLFDRVNALLLGYHECLLDLKEIHNYYFLDDETKKIVNYETTAKTIQAKTEFLMQLIESKKFTMVGMVEELKELQDSLTILEVQVQNYRLKSDELRMDERRIKEETRNLRVVLIEIKSQIRTKHLPIIDESYKTFIADGYHSIHIVDDLLKKRPLPLNELNMKLNDARDLVFKLYDNVHNLIVTAEMVENAIVFGNRYRSLSSEVESELTKAELYFRNGEYTRALEISIDVMERIQPGSYEKLLSAKERR